jgi:hypothetical protein
MNVANLPLVSRSGVMKRRVLSFEIFGSVNATASELGVLFPEQFDGCLPRMTQMFGVGIDIRHDLCARHEQQ